MSSLWSKHAIKSFPPLTAIRFNILSFKALFLFLKWSKRILFKNQSLRGLSLPITTKFMLTIRKMLLQILSCMTHFWVWLKKNPKAKKCRKIQKMKSSLRKFKSHNQSWSTLKKAPNSLWYQILMKLKTFLRNPYSLKIHLIRTNREKKISGTKIKFLMTWKTLWREREQRMTQMRQISTSAT